MRLVFFEVDGGNALRPTYSNQYTANKVCKFMESRTPRSWAGWHFTSLFGQNFSQLYEVAAARPESFSCSTGKTRWQPVPGTLDVNVHYLARELLLFDSP